MSRGRGYRGIEILVLWAAFLFVILIVLDGWRIKLASGGFFALAILSAIAVHEGISWIATKTRRPARALLMTGLMAAVASTCLTPIVLYTKPKWQTEFFEIDAELLAALSVVRAETSAAIPTLLTDARTGRYLPALAPVRVYAGHWSLTVDVVDKVHRLIAAGFERESAARPLPAPERRAALAELLSAARFDYVLVAKDRPAVALVQSQPGMHPAFEGERWLLFANDAKTD